MNRYGIQSVYSGKISINMNIVTQKKDFSVETKNRIKNTETREMFNLKNNIENLVNEKTDENYFATNEGMISSKFGLLNRFSK